MKDFFKPEDFDPSGPQADDGKDLCTYQWASNRANEKLNALIESWPVVYNYNEGLSSWWNPKEMVTTADNPVRQARLAFIEEIVKEPCKTHVPKLASTQPVHIPSSGDYFGTALLTGCSIVCAKCGVELQATWSEKK